MSKASASSVPGNGGEQQHVYYYSFPLRPSRAVSAPTVTNIFELTGRIFPPAVSVEIARRHLSKRSLDFCQKTDVLSGSFVFL